MYLPEVALANRGDVWDHYPMRLAALGAALVLVLTGTGLYMGRNELRCPTRPIAIIGDSNVAAMRLGPGCQNLGVSGDTSEKMAARFWPGQIKADTVVIWATANDVHYRKTYGVTHLQDMVRLAKEAGKRVILTTPIPVIDQSLRQPEPVTNARIRAYAESVRALASQEGVPVADLNAALEDGSGGPLKAFYVNEAGTYEHLTNAGRRQVWRVILGVNGR